MVYLNISSSQISYDFTFHDITFNNESSNRNILEEVESRTRIHFFETQSAVIKLQLTNLQLMGFMIYFRQYYQKCSLYNLRPIQCQHVLQNLVLSYKVKKNKININLITLQSHLYQTSTQFCIKSLR